MRGFAFDGVSNLIFMSHALELVTLLLHVSALFFLELIEFLFLLPINDTVMFVVLGFIIESLKPVDYPF